MKNCDCFYGILYEEIRLLKSNYIKSLDWQACYHWKKDMTPKKLIDGRKRYFTKFMFCPYCGEKIDWGTIKLSLAE